MTEGQRLFKMFCQVLIMAALGAFYWIATFYMAEGLARDFVSTVTLGGVVYTTYGCIYDFLVLMEKTSGE